MIDKNIFQKNAELFRIQALETFLKSPEYSALDVDLDSTLILADRVMEAFFENIEFNQIRKISSQLADISQAIESKEDIEKPVESLMQASEQWLKPILRLVYPNRWERLNLNKKSFTLFPTIRELDLLTQLELDKSEQEANSITDEVRQLIFWNRKDRNYVTHETTEAPTYIKARFLTVALVTLLAPVIKHKKAISAALKNLIASPFPSAKLEEFMTLLNGERLKHLERFCAREKWIVDLTARLRSDSLSTQPYFLLVGHEGIGKSAICAKLTEVLSSNSSLGRNADDVRKVAPWLPSVLLHFGKQSNQQDEITSSLIAQANTLLLEPYQLPQAQEDELEVESMSRRLFVSRPVRQVSNPQRDEFDEAQTFSDTYDLQPPLQTSRGRRRITVSDSVKYRRAIYLTLERVSQERGPIVVIIDAIDEISSLGTALDFLPERLPRGVSALLTGRQNTPAVEWVTNNREIEKIRLTGLQKAEIPLLTKINDTEGDAEARFNERVLRASHGWPVLVLAAARRAQNHRHDLDSVQIDTSVDSVFARQASEWQFALTQGRTKALSKVLMLLSAFEPATALDLSLVQSYLEFNGLAVSLIEVRHMLGSIAAQIEGLEIGRIKLSLKAFGEYVRTRYCSKRDLREVLKNVCDWLGKDRDIDGKTIAPFLEYWLNPSEVSDEGVQEIVGEVVSTLISRHDSNLLYEIYLLSRDKKLRKDSLLPFALRCLVASAETSDVRAMRVIGGRLIDGVGVEKDLSTGEVWLRRAAQFGDLRSMVSLGRRLLEGDGLAKDRADGELWLRKASERGDVIGSLTLAVSLLDDHCETRNREEGEHLLRSLAETDEVGARFILGHRLIHGKGLPQNKEEGQKLLSQLAEEGNRGAGRMLSSLLFDGKVLQKNAEEGEFWLRKSADAGDNISKRMLGVRLLDGTDLTQTREEGERLLRSSAEDGDTPSMRILGNRLLDGRGLIESRKEGEQWLRQASDAGNCRAMVHLGLRLIDGQGVTRNQHEGLKFLRKAAETGDAESQRILGNRLLNGRGISRNEKEGEQWLTRAASSGHVDSMLALGRRLVDGSGLKKDVVKGEEWLRKAAITENPEGMMGLASHLSTGKTKENITEAEDLAEKALAAGVGEAGVLLGRIRYLRGDNQGAASSLMRAMELNAENAAINLAYMIRRNELPAQMSTPTIEDLLLKSVEEKHVFGLINSALALASGTQCSQNWIAADERFANLVESSDPADALAWWHQHLIPRNDPEGHLVVGWLCRHKLITDPDGLSIKQRMDYARAGGWTIPAWMNEAVSNSSK